MKQFLKWCIYTLALMVVGGISACSNDDEVEHFEQAWEYESFMIEAYTADGKNPYLDENGIDRSNYPLGELITEPQGEKINFGSDGHLYLLRYYGWENETRWDDCGTYNVDGNQLFIDGYVDMFFPANQQWPAGFSRTDVTHEVLEWTDTKLSIRQVQLDSNSGTRIICTDNFRRVGM